MHKLICELKNCASRAGDLVNFSTQTKLIRNCNIKHLVNYPAA